MAFSHVLSAALKARWFAEGQSAAQGGDQRDRRNRDGWLIRRSRASGEVVRENPDLTVWVLPATIKCERSRLIVCYWRKAAGHWHVRSWRQSGRTAIHRDGQKPNLSKNIEIVPRDDGAVIQFLNFLQERFFGIRERQGSAGIGAMIEHQ
jgi:hypothetical protein